MEQTIVAALALAVVAGIAIMSWGGRRFNLSTGALAVAFTLTAVFWLAFLIAAISITVKSIALAHI